MMRREEHSDMCLAAGEPSGRDPFCGCYKGDLTLVAEGRAKSRINQHTADAVKKGEALNGLVTLNTVLTVRGGLPDDAAKRKDIPLCTGVLDYFPDALIEVAKCSKAGNDQHNPGQPLHWDKSKSTDHGNCILRHQVQRGTRDKDGVLHSAKVAWRALAQLQIEMDASKEDA